MSSIDCNELFQRYYQNSYDFNTESLSEDEILTIKKLVKEKRVDYAVAPMGTGIFEWIAQKNSNIRFELVPFESSKIDGMLYIPVSGKERAYIIINSNKALINQIFTAAHEFYHYTEDYYTFRDKPYVCDFSLLKDVNEKKASRFAAELLLPEEALRDEVREYSRMIETSIENMNFPQISVLIIDLTIKYQMPLKAIIYRLAEEGYIKKVDDYVGNYEFIKNIIRKLKIFCERIKELYETRNDYVVPYSGTYQDMEKAFQMGNASKETIIKDAKVLGMDMQVVEDIVQNVEMPDDEDDDAELISIIKTRWGNTK